MKRLFPILAAATLAAGCAVTPPVTLPVETPDEFLFARKGDTTLVIGAEWWEIFGDTTLNNLIAAALENNRDLLSAASKIEQARLQLGLAEASFLPQVSAGVSAEATYSTSSVTGAKAIRQQYSVMPSVSWEVSLFGAMRNSTEAARQTLLASEWGYRATRLSLAAQVAETYFKWLQYARSLEISERSMALRHEAQQKIDTMYYYGFSSAVDFEQARAMTATAAADIPSYRRAMIQANMALNTLVGSTPALLPPPPQHMKGGYGGVDTGLADSLCCGNLTAAVLPDYLPAGLPSSLLERRPDVMEAWCQVEAAAAKTRLARAQRFPSFTITGQGGLSAGFITGLTAHNPFYWLASGSLTEPIFSFGKLRRNEETAFENWREAQYAYEQTVLGALADVETALAAIETYASQSERYITLLDANRRLQKMTVALYYDGMSNYLNVIDAERNLYSSQMQYIELLTEQLTAYVELYKALGGGW